MLKTYGVVEWWVAHEILVSAQGPLVLDFWGLGPGLDISDRELGYDAKWCD